MGVPTAIGIALQKCRLFQTSTLNMAPSIARAPPPTGVERASRFITLYPRRNDL